MAENGSGIVQRTFTFKFAEGCPILVDVYHATSALRAPAILWLHPGALIIGSRTWLAKEQMELYIRAGFVVVAADYRLAPETKLPDIIADVQSAYAWLRSGAEDLPVDSDRIVVLGHSAGGYLALLAGHWLSPRPKALVSFYGYGDIAGAWHSQPDDSYRQQPLVTETEAYQAIGQGVLSESPFDPRIGFYVYCRQNGLWTEAIIGLDPLREPAAFDRYCPVRQVKPDYPPTMLVHGEIDTVVPVQQSINMAQACQRQGVESVLRVLPEMDHAFEMDEQALQDPVIAPLFEEVLTFIRKHVGLT
jgi:acetyl esterase/lipase